MGGQNGKRGESQSKLDWKHPFFHCDFFYANRDKADGTDGANYWLWHCHDCGYFYTLHTTPHCTTLRHAYKCLTHRCTFHVGVLTYESHLRALACVRTCVWHVALMCMAWHLDGLCAHIMYMCVCVFVCQQRNLEWQRIYTRSIQRYTVTVNWVHPLVLVANTPDPTTREYSLCTPPPSRALSHSLARLIFPRTHTRKQGKQLVYLLMASPRYQTFLYISTFSGFSEKEPYSCLAFAQKKWNAF